MTRAILAFVFGSAWTASAAAFPPNVSFQRLTIPAGNGPCAVVAGDFNGDGNLDVAFVNGNDNSVSTYLGDGHGNFFLAPNAPRATDAALSIAMAAGDLNGDGKLDVVATTVPGGLTGLWNSITGSIGGQASVLLGLGTGGLGSHDDYGVDADFPSAIAVGDFNGDGKLDLAVANLNSGNVSILLGHGDGTFGDAGHVAVGHRPTSVAVADLDGDGRLDLAVTNAADDTVSILRGRGDGTFSALGTSTVPSRPVAVAIGDFNGDGRPDLAVAGLLSSTVTVLLGDGAGSFPTSRTFGVARHPCAVVVGDFDNDGKQDLAVANRFSDSVSVLLGNGDGTFKAYRNFAVEAQPVALAAGDFNNDGKLDLVVANVDSRSLSLLLNNTDLTPPTLTMPAFAPSYVYESLLTLTFGATDAQSGVFSMAATLNGAPVVSGQTVLLDHPGTNLFTLTATDKVGNTATESATFAVLYNFGGFQPPVPNDGTGLFKLGSVIPLRFQLTDANGAPVATAAATLTAQRIAGTTLLGTPIDATAPGSADIGNLFKYSSGASTYSYNLDTKPLSTGTWQIQVRLNDGSVHAVAIGLK